MISHHSQAGHMGTITTKDGTRSASTTAARDNPSCSATGGRSAPRASRTRCSSSKLVRNAQLKVYEGTPHGPCTTLKDEVNADLLEFIKS
jgi:hypothetical protein